MLCYICREAIEPGSETKLSKGDYGYSVHPECKDGPGHPVTRAEHYERLQEALNDPETRERWEITEEIYEHFLCLLPPLRYRDGDFYFPEFYSGNLTVKYSQIGGRYFAEFAHYLRG